MNHDLLIQNFSCRISPQFKKNVFTVFHHYACLTLVQGGKFDHADRLFQSIDSAYRNSLSSTSDVKELIPEFFYMPEFLENSNSYHLGVKQDGEPIGNVALPPWAKVLILLVSLIFVILLFLRMNSLCTRIVLLLF